VLSSSLVVVLQQRRQWPVTFFSMFEKEKTTRMYHLFFCGDVATMKAMVVVVVTFIFVFE
jgi:hypothetical protein